MSGQHRISIEHRMSIEQDNGNEVLLVCPVGACGRRLVLSRSGSLTVLSRGDFFASHVAGSAGLTISARPDAPFA
jgi:hypothetical protein